MATALKATVCSTVHTVNQISIVIAGFFSLSHARIHFDTVSIKVTPHCNWNSQWYEQYNKDGIMHNFYHFQYQTQ